MYSQVTDFKRSTTKFTWNFDDLDVAGLFTVYNSAHKSESFVVLDTNNETVMTCKVMLFLKGRKGLENSVSLDLFMFVPPDSKTISCQISSSYKNSEKIYIPVGNHRTFNIDPENSGRHQLGTTPNISSWAVVNSVEFLIQVTVFSKCNTISKSFIPKNDAFSHNMSAFLFEEKFADFQIVVGKRKIWAHRVILAARSPVFAAMLEADMKEKVKKEVKLTNVSFDVIQEMMRYIYTGVAEKLDQLSFELLNQADKYQMDDLKIICGEKLVEGLTIDNAADILVLADVHNAEDLKQNVIEFTKNNMKQIMATDTWKKLPKSSKVLVNKMLAGN